MEIYFFLACGVLFLLFVTNFGRKHNNKVKEILKNNVDVQPLLMMKSVDLRINNIKAAIISSDGLYDEHKTEKQAIAKQLHQLTDNYQEKQIDLLTYHAKLGDMLIQATQVKLIVNTRN